jgi:hypothetical protein
MRLLRLCLVILLMTTGLAFAASGVDADEGAGGAADTSAKGSVLPFPSPPMGGKVGPTMQESVHKWREQPRRLPEDAPNISDRHVR